MTTTTTMTTRPQERAKPLASSAAHRHVFTLNFAGGQVALLDVRGAADSEQARSIAQQAIKRSRYSVTDGDQTAGRAASFYFWCSSAAQEVRPHRTQRDIRLPEVEQNGRRSL